MPWPSKMCNSSMSINFHNTLSTLNSPATKSSPNQPRSILIEVYLRWRRSLWRIVNFLVMSVIISRIEGRRIRKRIDVIVIQRSMFRRLLLIWWRISLLAGGQRSRDSLMSLALLNMLSSSSPWAPWSWPLSCRIRCPFGSWGSSPSISSRHSPILPIALEMQSSSWSHRYLCSSASDWTTPLTPLWPSSSWRWSWWWSLPSCWSSTQPNNSTRTQTPPTFPSRPAQVSSKTPTCWSRS